MACGGKSITGEGQDDEASEDEDAEIPSANGTKDGKDDDEAVMEFPNVGGGRGSGNKTLAPTTLQPIVYHEFPVTFWQGIMHAVSASTIIDLAPQSGRLAKWCVMNRIGYVGICQTDVQKQHIAKIAQDAVMVALADPASMISVAKFTGKRAGEDLPETSRARKKGGAPPDDTPANSTPLQPTGKASSPASASEGLSPALLAMLQAAKGVDP